MSSANGQVILSGEASDAVSAARAVEVAQGLSQKPVVNAMKISTSQQVMLKVRIFEVDRNTGRDLGINLFGGNGVGKGFTGLGSVANTTNPNGTTGILPSGVFPGGGAAATPFGALLAQLDNTNGLKLSICFSALKRGTGTKPR